MTTTYVRNRSWRSLVTVIEERADASRLGRAGARLRLDGMLAAIHGVPDAEWRRLDADERAVLRRIAREPAPPEGEGARATAMVALGRARDVAALPLLMHAAGDGGAGPGVRAAAVRALAALRDEQALPVLRALARSDPAELRVPAIHALREMGTAADLVHLDALADADATRVGEAAREAAASVRARLGIL